MRKGVGRDRNRHWVREYKEHNPCVSCGEGNPALLTFHHRREKDKIDTIAHMVTTRSLRTLVAEVRKCDVMCEQCHSELHNPHLVERRAERMLISYFQEMKPK